MFEAGVEKRNWKFFEILLRNFSVDFWKFSERLNYFNSSDYFRAYSHLPNKRGGGQIFLEFLIRQVRVMRPSTIFWGSIVVLCCLRQCWVKAGDIVKTTNGPCASKSVALISNLKICSPVKKENLKWYMKFFFRKTKIRKLRITTRINLFDDS